MTLPNVVAVVDTNVLVSGLIGKPGPPASILNAFAVGRFTLATSELLLDELEIVTLRPEVSKRFNPTHLVELWLTIREGAMVVTPASREPVTDDPVDNALFTTAIAAGAEVVITGDRRLLTLEKVDTVRVMSPHDFLAWLQKRRPASA